MTTEKKLMNAVAKIKGLVKSMGLLYTWVCKLCIFNIQTRQMKECSSVDSKIAHENFLLPFFCVWVCGVGVFCFSLCPLEVDYQGEITNSEAPK